MPRTIAYKVPGRPRRRGNGRLYGATAPRAEGPELAAPDTYAERLVKYIPAETLAFVVPTTAISDDRDVLVVGVAIAGAFGQLLWLKKNGDGAPLNARPTVRFYVFALFAYVAWVLGTSGAVRALVGIDIVTGSVLMATAAYLLPLIDPVAHDRLDARPPPALTR